MLDNPEVVRGRRVIDLGAGSGVAAIAAMLAGAEHAIAVDIDPAHGIGFIYGFEAYPVQPISFGSRVSVGALGQSYAFQWRTHLGGTLSRYEIQLAYDHVDVGGVQLGGVQLSVNAHLFAGLRLCPARSTTGYPIVYELISLARAHYRGERERACRAFLRLAWRSHYASPYEVSSLMPCGAAPGGLPLAKESSPWCPVVGSTLHRRTGTWCREFESPLGAATLHVAQWVEHRLSLNSSHEPRERFHNRSKETETPLRL
ncbi:MAG TPA: 50S ribosomal protein L11 methyltransferase [Polyangiales bacterium]|nr:50S ribosomal protein L11 methyltransferase [Polyangiales bacterium]